MSSEWAEQAGSKVDTGAAADSNAAPGKILAAQREALGWSVEQVAEQLKLAVRQVVALEAGDDAALPGPAVVRGFVRAYAKIVRLDPAPLVAKIALDTGSPGEAGHSALRHNKPASFSEVRFPSHGKRSSLPLLPIVSVLVIVGAAAAAWHYGLLSKFSSRADSGAASSAVVAAPIGASAVTPAPLATPSTSTPLVSGAAPIAAPSLQNPSVPLISVPPPSSVTPGSPAAGSPAVAPAATAAVAAPAPGANALVLAVREDSWIEIRRAKGAPLISRLVKGGSTESFEITEPVTLVVGKPDAVGATLRGSAVALPAARGAVARVSLK